MDIDHHTFKRQDQTITSSQILKFHFKRLRSKLPRYPYSYKSAAEMRAKATIRLNFKSKKHLAAAFKALEPETKGAATSRFQVRVERDGNLLILNLEAGDTSALRSAINSYLNWVVLMRDIFLA